MPLKPNSETTSENDGSGTVTIPELEYCRIVARAEAGDRLGRMLEALVTHLNSGKPPSQFDPSAESRSEA